MTTVSVDRARLILDAVIGVLAMLVTVYGIRVQMKLAGITILLATAGMLWLRDIRSIRKGEDLHQLMFLFAVVLAAAIVSAWMLATIGPQPFSAAATTLERD